MIDKGQCWELASVGNQDTGVTPLTMECIRDCGAHDRNMCRKYKKTN